MFIANPSLLSNTYQTSSKTVANYLIKNNIPLLGNQDGIFYFSQTDKLHQVLGNSSLLIRWLA